MIQKLNNNQIFVFGSNLAGNHSGGAAAYAVDNFGATIGKGEGLQGQSYALPTLDHDMRKLTTGDLLYGIAKLYQCAERHPEKEFLLTEVGTGIAGYDYEYMKSLFLQLPKNITSLFTPKP